ncbi:MAG: sigma 54-interacting transcriptional regulator [Formivibrio sp.]|nr:sigma 54-interacting transcriptional regulator [Formivibrio sp.]
MTSILFLAPFGAMAETAIQLAESMGITLTVETTDDDHAVENVCKHPEIEVVVSRGGVAERIKAMERISVVEIAMTVDEFLDAISRFSKKGMRNIGFVGRANIFGGASGDFKIAETNVYFRSCVLEEEIEKNINSLQEKGVDAIIGCRLGYERALEHGINAERLSTSSVSIKNALEEAVRLVKAKEMERLQSAQLAAIINNIEEGVIAVDGDNRVNFYNDIAKKLCTNKNGSIDLSMVSELLYHGRQEKIANINGSNVLTKSIPLEVNGRKFGDVITFQETSSIQTHERKIRLTLYQKGLYAKKFFADMLGESDELKRLVEKAKKYASHDSNLLIYGETGTGKEVLAQSVHNASRRKNGPFVSINTASLPPSLLESELFGYVDGAFTGAKKGGKPGLFELAHGGTIFLDEIGELTPDIQSRLLRVLQEKEIMRLGDDRIIPVDVRIISATNRDLFDLVKKGGFREDLYYRIYVLGLRIPPLRERSEDVAILFEMYVNNMAEKEGRTIGLTKSAIDTLMNYTWPGNIRQLKNIAEVVACCGPDIVDDVYIAEVLAEQETKIDIRPKLQPEKKFVSIKEMEADLLRNLLNEHSIDDVCKKLGISRVTLWRKKKALLQN